MSFESKTLSITFDVLLCWVKRKRKRENKLKRKDTHTHALTRLIRISDRTGSFDDKSFN